MDKPEIILDFNIPIQYKTQRASLNKPIMARHFFLLFFLVIVINYLAISLEKTNRII